MSKEGRLSSDHAKDTTVKPENPGDQRESKAAPASAAFALSEILPGIDKLMDHQVNMVNKSLVKALPGIEKRIDDQVSMVNVNVNMIKKSLEAMDTRLNQYETRLATLQGVLYNADKDCGNEKQLREAASDHVTPDKHEADPLWEFGTDDFFPGDRVVLFDLATAHLNGLRGTILNSHTSGRLVVVLDGSEKRLLVRPQNLAPLFD